MADDEEGLEASVTSVVEQLPAHVRTAFVEIIGEFDPRLLASLRRNDVPTMSERVAVHDILSDEFMKHIGPDSEPTERGKLIDDALGKFLTLWQIEE